MIAFLRGVFAQKTPANVLIDAGGVGYDVNISLNTYDAIQHLEEGTLHTHLIVREDAHILYGFAEPREKELFLMLLSVSGVGAATARMVLSYLKPEEVSRAITAGNARELERVKGIGRKGAERIVLELRDKLTKNPIDAPQPGWKGNTLDRDALEALVALGIPRNAADAAVSKIIASGEETTVEGVIKKALQSL